MRSWVCGICLLGLAASVAADEAPRPSALELQQLLEKIRAKHDLPALAGAIVTDKGLQVMAAVGVRKRGEKIKVVDDDQFHLGSDTKPITAWLIAWLVDQGLLTWNTSLEQIFPEFAKSWSEDHRGITVTQLLTHHSGLPANYPGGWWLLDSKDTPRDQRLALMKQLGDVKLAGKPGAKYLYSIGK